MADSESPLIQALPPVSDYITYLTIVEYNLKPENLPLLHKVLQDETLTINIGWDLVHLLAPYLPESEQCLQDIARLGNPREVILKVTEVLRLIEYQDDDDEQQSEEDDDAEAGASVARSQADASTFPLKTAPTTEGTNIPGNAQAVEVPPPLPLQVSQFIALLSMLEILHPRIKTKYPSRFLSTTLQAILASFSNSPSHREEMVQAIVRTVSAVSGVRRPALPSRKSSGMLDSIPKVANTPAADPEGTAGVEISTEERALERKLLQAFVTHVLEEYMLNLSSHDDVPGMAWCSRIMEKVHPERNIPESKTFASRFGEEEGLHRRIDAIGQLVMLSQDLKIADEDLLSATLVEEKMPETEGDEDEPPSSAEDIPLSRLGSLLLYSARQVSSILYDRPLTSSKTPFELFPHHQEMLKHGLSASDMGAGQLGTEPEALIDCVLALGLVSLERNQIGEPKDDEQFNEYLQVIALLSSNCPNSNLRGHAHYLTSTVLRSQPDDNARLSFIRDTLEHCPFENLKVAAVGWIKGETIEANPMTSMSGHSHGAESSDSVFAKPLALDSLAPFLFPSLQADLISAPIQDAWMTFQTNVSFYLSSLNFLFLLLQAPHIREKLAISDLWKDADIAASFLQPLRDAKKRFEEALKDGGELATERSESVVAELALLETTVGRVTAAVGNLNQ